MSRDIALKVYFLKPCIYKTTCSTELKLGMLKDSDSDNVNLKKQHDDVIPFFYTNI